MKRTLATLFRYLDELPGPASLSALEEVVGSLDVECDELREHIRFSERGYARNLVRAGPCYHLLVLCWKNGQRSPIHDHAGSACCVRVLRGVLTETRFEFAANGHIKAIGSRDLPTGGVCVSQDADMHQVSNLQPPPADLVTLHIYSPPLISMGTYSLFDTLRGLEPMFVTFDDAAGI
jgi:cysteine dioxygenase